MGDTSELDCVYMNPTDWGKVEEEYGAKGYRYTVVNDRAVVVEPRTRRIVQIIN